MAKKPEISARETIVLDDKTLEELDDVSLTGVMRDMSETIDRLLEAEQESERQRESEESQSELTEDLPIPDLDPADARDDTIEDRGIADIFEDFGDD